MLLKSNIVLKDVFLTISRLKLVTESMRTVVFCQSSIQCTFGDITDRLVFVAVQVVPQVDSVGQGQVGLGLGVLRPKERRLPVLPRDRIKRPGRAENVEVEITELAGDLAQVLAPRGHVALAEGHHQSRAEVGPNRGALVLIVLSCTIISN